MKLVHKLAISTLLIASSSLAQADAIDQIKKMGANIISIKDSAASGYQAVFAEKDGKKRMFYVSPDKQFLFYGLMFNANGESITALDTASVTGNISSPTLSKEIVAESPSTPEVSSALVETEEIFNLAKSANYVSEGTGSDFYIIFDPNCPYCKTLYNQTRDYLGKAKLNWIPVAVLNDDSLGKSVSILEGGANSIKMVSSGAIRNPKVSNDDLNKLQKNVEILVSSNSTSVPTIVYKNKNGDVKIVSGLPPKDKLDKIFLGDK